MSISKKCVVEPLKHECTEGASDSGTDVKKALKLPLIPGLKDLAVGSNWKGCLELMKKHLGFWSDEYQQLQYAIGYDNVLEKAIEMEFTDFIKLLLHNDFPVNAEIDYNGRTTLHVGIKNNKINIVNLLLSYGADINLSDSEGLSAIHMVARYGCYDIAKILLQNSDMSSILCKDVDARDKRGNSALHFAAEYGHYDIVELLLERQENIKAIDVDARCVRGYTPLHLAAENGHANIVSRLIKEEVNINARTKYRETSLFLAVKNDHTEVVKTLLSFVYCDLNAICEYKMSALSLAAKNGNANIVYLLLQKQVNVNERTVSGETPLILAAKEGHTEVVKTLLSNPYCNIDAREKVHHYTALDWAKSRKHESVKELLINKYRNIESYKD